MPVVPFIPLIAGGVKAATGIYGSKKQQRGNDRALAAEERALLRQEKLDSETAAEQKLQWESDEKFRRDQFAASEETRIFQRGLDTYDQELQVAREARKTPYRQASRQSLGRLGEVLGLDFDQGYAVANPEWSRPNYHESDRAQATAARAGASAPPQGRQNVGITMGGALSKDRPGTLTPGRNATDTSYSPVNQIKKMRKQFQHQPIPGLPRGF